MYVDFDNASVKSGERWRGEVEEGGRREWGKNCTQDRNVQSIGIQRTFFLEIGKAKKKKKYISLFLHKLIFHF